MAIFVDRVLDRTARWDLRLRLHAWLAPAHAVDLVLPDDAPPLLAHRALQGRVLIERDRTAFTRFFVRTLAEAGDERHWSAVHARARQRRLAGGEFGGP